MADIKAYQTSAHGTRSIVFAKSRGTAMYVTMMAARDAGYKTDFTEVKAYRAPEYDAKRTIGGNIPVQNKCLNPTLLERTP